MIVEIVSKKWGANMIAKASALALSNNILQRGIRDRVKINPMKLQKLLYYVCVMYAKNTGSLPISERFEVWKSGPVLVSVYSEFEPFRSKPITSYSLNVIGEAKTVAESLNPIIRSCLDYVWRKMKGYSAMDLAERSCKKGSGWYSAYQQYKDEIRNFEKINFRSMIYPIM